LEYEARDPQDGAYLHLNRDSKGNFYKKTKLKKNINRGFFGPNSLEIPDL